MQIVQTENLVIGYHNKTIGKPFSFQLEEGKLYTLIGKNGMGKSTLIKTMSRLLPPISGTIELENTSLQQLSNEQFAQTISFVFTNQPVNKELSVYELIALGRQPYTNWMHQLDANDEKIIEESIEVTQLKTLQDKKLHQLSDGQLQRAFVARAIAQDTKIILLDEPSNHLDLYHKVQLFRLLKQLCITQNKCILFSCHDLDLALQLSDGMLVIKEENNYFDTPNALINQGIFDHFFDDDQIVFNKEQKRFLIL